MIKNLLERWPLVRQLKTGGDGTGPEAMTARTKNLVPRNLDADYTRSVCPYCAVGCGQMVFHKDGELISIEGDPGSPHSRGHLCPKGADTHELHTHAKRLMTVKYRRPHASEWEEIPLEQAMDMVADRLWESRNRNFIETQDGHPVMQATTIAHLGGATLDNEENYLIKKLFTGGLGMVRVSNQARI
jgi:formate dehydrogenase major subunit